jgi:RNA polymerase sigma-70 factor (ECF subfamily)
MESFASLEIPIPGTDGAGCAEGTGGECLVQAAELNTFLSEVERRACRIAEMAVRNRDDALDIVQGAMLRFARGYAARPATEWKPIFCRILWNGIRDFQRRRAVRSKIFAFLPGQRQDDEGREDPIAQVADGGQDPSAKAATDEAMRRLESALAALPARQQQAFALRCLEGLDVAGTAAAMGCSEGSVKTHYFRAMHTLRGQLGEVW